MTDILIYIFATLGTLFALLAAVGIIRMPDAYLRISVNTKAATLGVGLLLGASAIYFYDFSVTTRVQAIVIFIFLTAPVGAHLIGRTSYFLGNKLWEGSVIDDLKDRYNKSTHELKSDDDVETNQDHKSPETESHKKSKDA